MMVVAAASAHLRAMIPRPIDLPTFRERIRTGAFDVAGAPGAAEPPLVVLDLDAAPPPATAPDGAPPLDASLPLVLAGVTGHEPPEAHPAAGACDLVVATGAPALGAVAETVAAQPLAALTLASVLRGSFGRSTGEGLLLESLAYSTLQAGPEFARWRAGRAPRARAGEGPAVRVTRHGDRLEVTLTRPEVRNALNTEMRDGLVEAFRLAAVDGSIAAVHLRGEGPSFCAGGDLDEFGSFPDPATAHAVRLAQSAARLIAEVAGRVTAHLHGACFGSGIELPAFAGRVVAAPDTVVALPEVALGLIPGAGGTVSLPRRIGRHRTARLALTGERLDAGTALDWGLVDETSG